MKNVRWLLLSSMFLLTFLLNTASLSFVRINNRLTGTFRQNHNPALDAYDVKFYFIDIEVSDSTTYIHGSTTLLIELLDTNAEYIVLDMGGMLSSDSVLLNGQKANYLHQDDELMIYRPFPLSAANMISIQIFYNGSADTNNNFANIFNAVDREWGNKVTWTLSEPFYARNWFPCKQVLTDKADSVYVFITTDQNLRAGSNGLLTAETSLPGDKVRYEWKSRYPVAFYLISFAVSDYRDYSFYARYGHHGDSLLVQNYIYDNDLFLENNKSQIDNTADLISLFSELFCPYPFRKEKYGHCVVPSRGGMEHQTMTTLESFSFTLVGHELAHQWFGNYVTCGTWQDIWINEGFASYGEYLSYQYLISQAEADRWMRDAHTIIKFRKDGSIYIPENDLGSENRIFDYRLSYKKGAAIIHMIRHEINNDSLFFKILRDFLDKYKYDTATGMDFKNILEQKTDIDFTDFFNQWYFGEGYPIIRLNWQHQNDTLYIHASQTTTASTTFFNIPIDFKITANGKDTVIRCRHQENPDSWSFHIPGSITHLEADPDHWLLADFSYISDTTGSFSNNKGQHSAVFNVDNDKQ